MPCHPSLWLVLLLSSASSPSFVAAYPGGAPDSACSEMTPNHGTYSPQLDETIPYSVTVDKPMLRPGETTAVTIWARMGGRGFKGFLLQARRVDEPDQRVGTFTISPMSGRTKDCGDGANVDGGTSAVTHVRRRSPMRMARAQWTAPTDVSGDMDVVFVASVVQRFSTFWVQHKSQMVKVMAR